MKTLTKYLVKRALLNWFFSMVGLITVMIFGDIAGNIKHFSKLPLTSLPLAFVEHYLENIPLWLPLLLPISALLSLTVLAAQMIRSREWIAICSGGLSLRGQLLPLVFLVSITAGGLQWFNQETWIPSLPQEGLSLKEKTRKRSNEPYSLRQGITAKKERLQGTWYPQRNLLKDILIVAPDYVLRAERGTWIKTGWNFRDVIIYRPQPMAMPYSFASYGRWTWKTNLGPLEMSQLYRNAEDMNRQDLLEQVKRFPRQLGLKMAAADRLGQPFSAFALIFVGLPLALRQSSALKAASQVVLVALMFFITQSVCFRLGAEGSIHTYLATFIPLGLMILMGLNFWKKIST